MAVEVFMALSTEVFSVQFTATPFLTASWYEELTD
jgi:hypothetical protein